MNHCQFGVADLVVVLIVLFLFIWLLTKLVTGNEPDFLWVGKVLGLSTVFISTMILIGFTVHW